METMKRSALIYSLIKIYYILFVIYEGDGFQTKSVSRFAQSLAGSSSWINNRRNTQIMDYQSSSKSTSWLPPESRSDYNSFSKHRRRYQSPLRNSNSVPKSLHNYQKHETDQNKYKNSELFPSNTYRNKNRRQSRPQPLRGRLPTGHRGSSTRNNNIPLEVLEGLPSVVQGIYSRYSRGGTATTTAPTTTSDPPVVWFPDLNHDCEAEESGDGGGGGGFNAFSFLAMVVSVGNVVSLLASNANNNINNNNENNNINNDNIQDSNEGNNNNNLDTFTMIMFGGRRRKRDLNNGTFGITSDESSPSEDVAYTVGLLFLRTWYSDLLSRSFLNLSSRNVPPIHDGANMHQNPHSDEEFVSETQSNANQSLQSRKLVGNEIQANTIKIHHMGNKLRETNPTSVVTSNCLKRSFCQANRESAQLGKLGEDIAEILSLGYTELVEGSIVPAQEFLRAGTQGRKGGHCESGYPCASYAWAHINTLHHGAIMEKFLAL